MATKTITLKGKAQFCKPWPGQVDMAFAVDIKGEADPRGGNNSTGIALDAESAVLFEAVGAKAKVKDGYLKLRRYQRHPVLGELGPVKVTGVPEGTLIGNDSEITVTVDVYDYGDRFGKKGMRWMTLNVDKLVPFEKKEDKAKSVAGAVPFDVPVD